MHYEYTAIPAERIPKAAQSLFQHALDAYASETNKVISVWRLFRDEDLDFRPHPRSSVIGGRNETSVAFRPALLR
jgi:hypothetical protein